MPEKLFSEAEKKIQGIVVAAEDDVKGNPLFRIALLENGSENLEVLLAGNPEGVEVFNVKGEVFLSRGLKFVHHARMDGVGPIEPSVEAVEDQDIEILLLPSGRKGEGEEKGNKEERDAPSQTKGIKTEKESQKKKSGDFRFRP